MQLKFLQLLIGSVAINQQRTFLLQINWTCALIQNFDIITTSSQKIFIINSLFYSSNMQIINNIVLSLSSLLSPFLYFLLSLLHTSGPAQEVHHSTLLIIIITWKIYENSPKAGSFYEFKVYILNQRPLSNIIWSSDRLPITSGLSTWHVNLNSSSTACLGSQCTTLISCHQWALMFEMPFS